MKAILSWLKYEWTDPMDDAVTRFWNRAALASALMFAGYCALCFVVVAFYLLKGALS